MLTALTIYSDNTRVVEIRANGWVPSLIFLEDGKHLLSGGEDGMIRQWRVEDGTEAGQAMKAIQSSCAWNDIALSGDRKWIVSSQDNATVWNRHTHQRALTVNKDIAGEVVAVDVSPDSTRFATGARDGKAFIWDILNGRRLVGPLQCDNNPTVVTFSPSGDHIATTAAIDSLRIHNAHTGELLRTVLITSIHIAWSRDSQCIFVLSFIGVITQVCIDTGTILSEWTVSRGKSDFGSLTLSSDGGFIASFFGNSLSFWDTSTPGMQLGPVFNCPPEEPVVSVALSLDSKHLAVSNIDGKITLYNLTDIIPTSYSGGQSIAQQAQPGSCVDLQLQFEAFRGEFRALELRIGTFLHDPSCF